mgnify:CR=1 FL=1
MTRNQWRGILRFGVFNAIKLNIDIRRNHTTPEHHLAVCAIAKNEGPYFKEWVEWHLSQGVDRFSNLTSSRVLSSISTGLATDDSLPPTTTASNATASTPDG